MRNGAIVWCVCLVVSSRGALLVAQEPERLEPGMRVRVNAPEQASKRIVGTLTAVDASVLTIQTSNDEVVVRRDAIQTLELSERRGWKRRGALIGAGLGLVAAVIAAAAEDEPEPFINGRPLFTRTDMGMMYGILAVPVGAIAGALIAPGERWASAPSAFVGPAKGADGRGLQFGVRIPF